MLRLPDAARVACWLNAWLSGREGADATISGLRGGGSTEFVGTEPGTRLPPALFLGELRRLGVRRASSALPVPGDPLGLGGPATFNADALEARGGVVLHGSGLAMVPVRAVTVTTWHLSDADEPTYLPAVADADRALRAAMTGTANALASLDVASWRPDVADALLNVRRPVTQEPAPYASPQAARLAHDALRAASIFSLAKADDGGAVSASEAAQRAAALMPLDRAARAAVVAATSTLDGR